MSEAIFIIAIGLLVWIFVMPIFKKAQADGLEQALELDQLKKWDEDRRKIEILKAAFPEYTQPPKDK